MAASSDMFVSVMRQSGLSKNEIENFIFDIAHKNNTDDHTIIADTFLRKHCVNDAAGTTSDGPTDTDMEGFRVEIKNFLHCCTDLEAQRVVRSRKSDSNPVAVLHSVGLGAGTPSSGNVAQNNVATQGKNKERVSDGEGDVTTPSPRTANKKTRDTGKGRKVRGGEEGVLATDKGKGISNGGVAKDANVATVDVTRMTMTSFDNDDEEMAKLDMVMRLTSTVATLASLATPPLLMPLPLSVAKTPSLPPRTLRPFPVSRVFLLALRGDGVVTSPSPSLTRSLFLPCVATLF